MNSRSHREARIEVEDAAPPDFQQAQDRAGAATHGSRRPRLIAMLTCALALLAPCPALPNAPAASAGVDADGTVTGAPAASATTDDPQAAAPNTPEETPAEAPATTRLDSPLARSGAPDPLFADSSVLEVRLEGPLRALARDSDDRPEERPAVLSWQDARGNAVSLDIEIRPRGKSRRRREVCEFPPIRLDIPKSRAEGTLFENQDKLKLVTQCVRLGSRSRQAPDWVALEFLAYRILNLVTDYSFRVRPLAVTYVDERGKAYVHPAFIIEADDRLGVRLGLEESELPSVAPADFAPDIAQVMELFEYLIGNTDFSFISGPPDEACCHNAVQFTNGERFTPIPYDFDLTGIVDKPDALPADGLGLRRVTQRRYRGFCRDAAVLDRAIDLFAARRAAIEAEIASPQLPLSSRAQRSAQRFLDGFYATVLDPEGVERNISGRCRG